jgi:hypothetical protein
MGQYYKAVVLKDNKKTIEKFVTSWSYSNGSKLMEHSWVKNQFVKSFESLIHNNPKRVVWAGDYADECKGLKTNVYNRCNDKLEVKPNELNISDSRFVINHSKKMFVDKTKVLDNDGWQIHPLPLLTCEGNGRGGGDFRGESDLVGSWARDLISVSKDLPNGYKELVFDLIED